MTLYRNRNFQDEVGPPRCLLPKGASRILITALTALLALLMWFPQAALAQDDWTAPRTVLIPETGHTIDGLFLDVWREQGGAAAFGHPITQEFEAKGRTVQYFEYARFEYVPNDPNGELVQFGNIGRELKPTFGLRSVFQLWGNVATSSFVDIAQELEAWLPVTQIEARVPDSATRRYVAETQHTVQNGFKDFWEATGEAAYLGNPISEEFQRDNIRYQVFERGQLSWTSGRGVTMEPVGSMLVERYGLSTAPSSSASSFPTYSEELFIPPPPAEPQLPSNPGGERWISINLSSQYLVVYEGDLVVNETFVSTGRPGFETPTGTFYINSKYEVQDMEGMASGETWFVPEVPHVMYFTDYGHAVHGTYWHNNFGAVMSHGCVNLPLDFADWLFHWAPFGMRVEITY